MGYCPMSASSLSVRRSNIGCETVLTSGSGPNRAITPASFPRYLSKSFLFSILTRTHLPLSAPLVPGVQAFEYAMMGAMDGDTMRTLTNSLDHPRPKGPQDSSCAFDRPNDVNWSRVHSLACFALGEPVRRGPMPSIKPLAISMILELRKPS